MLLQAVAVGRRSARQDAGAPDLGRCRDPISRTWGELRVGRIEGNAPDQSLGRRQLADPAATEGEAFFSALPEESELFELAESLAAELLSDEPFFSEPFDFSEPFFSEPLDELDVTGVLLSRLSVR
jgi:hypothetical protein